MTAEIISILLCCGVLGYSIFTVGKDFFDAALERKLKNEIRIAEKLRLIQEEEERELRKKQISIYLNKVVKISNGEYSIYNYGRSFTILNSQESILPREVLCILRKNFDTNIKLTNIVSRNKNRCHSINWHNIKGKESRLEDPLTDLCHVVCYNKYLCIDKDK